MMDDYLFVKKKKEDSSQINVILFIVSNILYAYINVNFLNFNKFLNINNFN